MKSFHKYLGSLLLFVVFTMKIVTPAFSSYCFAENTPLETQQEKSTEEKSAEKSFSYASEVAEITFFQSDLLVSALHTFTFAPNQRSFLPFQYFAIPTPPPWGNN